MSRRSLLFSPGDRSEMLQKAPESGADVIVFDLEDGVAPARKDEARETVREVLADPDFDPDCEVGVRVNPIGRGAARDVSALAGLDEVPDCVLLPKVADADDVTTLKRRLEERDLSLPVIALIETASGVLHAEGIAAVPATDALFFGAEDLAADLGATRTDEGTEVLHAREHVVLAASAADVDAIDTVYTDLEDLEGVREAARVSARLGFDGKAAIHPDQVAPINEAFTPDPEEVEWARRVLAAHEEASAADRGVFRVDDEMIDAPLIGQARTIVDRARAAGVWEED